MDRQWVSAELGDESIPLLLLWRMKALSPRISHVRDAMDLPGWSNTVLAMCSLDSVSRIGITVSALNLRHDRQPNLLRRSIGLTSGQSGVREYWACLLYQRQMDSLVNRITQSHSSFQSFSVQPCNRVVGLSKGIMCSRGQEGDSDTMMSLEVI